MMKKIFQHVFCILIVCSLVSCTIALDQPTTVNGSTVVPPTTSAVTHATGESNQTGTTPSWANLNLSGKLVYSTFSNDSNSPTTRIQLLDLVTGETKTLFTVTGNAWIYYLAVSPDHQQILISYAPPAQDTAQAYTTLYTLPLAVGAEPQRLIATLTTADRYLQAEWSPDGHSIYFVHYNFSAQPANEIYPHYHLFRMSYPNGQPQQILDQAFWPRLSPDGSKLLYVSLDPVSGVNQLFLADSDGSQAQEVMLSGAHIPEVIDAPIFAPDGQSILFSSPSPTQSYQPNWLDRLFGVQIAEAHSIPSDWWSVPISGGTPTRLTYLQTIKLFASLSPDDKYLASVSGEGIFVMQPDGSNLTRVVDDTGVTSTVNWIP